MAWMKIDDRVRTHPKIVQAGPAAAWFWFCGICYCREHLTDGFIPAGMLPSLAPGVKNGRTLAATLVRERLWEPAEGGYAVHDFLEWNPSRADVEAQRRADLARKAAGKSSDSRRNISGLPQDSSVSRDAHAGSGSLSPSEAGGSPSVIDSTPEGGPGDTAHHPPLPRRVGVVQRASALGIVPPGVWERQHAKHALREHLCDWVCLPEAVYAEWLNRMTAAGQTREQAEADALAWVVAVRARWTGRVPGDDNFAFWRHEWASQHGSNRPIAATSRAQTGALDGVREALRRG